MENNDIQLVGGPCGQHGPYTFYKAFKYTTKNGDKRIVTLSEFFFVKLWIDSDLLCIGELQLLWIDKNSEQVLASLRLYFLPENTPEGRMDHGEDEVLAISEKVVLRVEDLVTWITVDAEWTWGILAKTESEVEQPKNIDDAQETTGLFVESSLDFSDVEKERNLLDLDKNGPSVVILSYPRYCRYRAMMKRLEGVENEFLKFKIVNALGGFTVMAKNTRVLFCRETFDYPDLEGHELLCNHLAPKLKGRPRGKRKKRSVSPGSESNESESSITNVYTSGKMVECEAGTSSGRRSTRLVDNSECKEFIKKLNAFMKSNRTPIGRVPSLGYKEIDLHGFYVKVQKLGGYDSVTTNRLWKSIFDDMSGHQNSTSAATVIRRHYERFLLPYERHMKGEEYKPLPVSERRRLKSKAGSSVSDTENSEGTSRSGNTTPIPGTPVTTTTPTENKEFNIQVKAEVKTSSLRSVRVKPDRQKDKQVNSEKCNVQNININITTTTTMEKSALTSAEDSSPTSDKTNVIENSSVVKTEPQEDIKLEIIPISDSFQSIKTENVTQKTEIIPIKMENIPDKNAEPLTSAVAPVAQKVSPDKTLSPVEGKESMPIIKTGDTASTNGKNNEFLEVPYKPKSPEIESNLERYKSINNSSFSIMQEVKKRKLDILKEGGLEVTPVKSSPVPISKDIRPSVIQQNLPIPHISAKIVPSDIQTMPPPSISKLSSRRLSVNLPQNLDISPSTIHKAANKEISNPPSRNNNNNNIHSNINGCFPPKVVQSKSIYSYSEKIVYGNPRETLNPPPQAAHTPRVPSSYTRSSGGDILDLTVTSPQKPMVEIMRVPIVSSSNYYNSSSNNHRESTQPKVSYKESQSRSSNRSTAPYIDGRRLGSNLEITLVGPTNSRQTSSKSNNNLPSSSLVNTPSNHSRHSHKRISNDTLISNKIPRLDATSSKYMKNSTSNYSLLQRESKNNLELSIPNPYNKNYSSKSESSSVSYSKQSVPNSTSSLNSKHFPSLSGSAQLSPYLAQLPSYPLLNPLYYSAIAQSIPPMIPFNPDHLKLYTDLLMSRDSRLPFNFPLPQDGSPSMLNNNNFKKP